MTAARTRLSKSSQAESQKGYFQLHISSGCFHQKKAQRTEKPGTREYSHDTTNINATLPGREFCRLDILLIAFVAAMGPPPAAGPSRVPARRPATSQPTASTPRPKVAKSIPTQPTAPAQVTRGTATARSAPLTASTIPRTSQDTLPAIGDTKPVLDQGEEEWAELMRGSYGAKKGADWYAKGVKSVQVSAGDNGRNLL